MMRTLKTGGTLLLLCALAGCDDSPSRPSTVNAVRGAYLVQAVLACNDCHTPFDPVRGVPDFSKLMAGGTAFAVGNAKVFAKNLTPDRETGLGKWSDAQIKRALAHGIDDQGLALVPVMPYWAFGNLSDGDLDSIVLYLRALRPVSNLVPDDTFAVQTPTPVLDPAQIPHTSLSPGDPNFASAERGRYLAGLAGACVSCHTPRTTNLDRPIDLTRAFSGGQRFELPGLTVASANLTPDLTGLGGWTMDDIISSVQFAKERGRGRALCPPMPAGPNRDGDMTNGDLTDIARYLTTLAPIANGPFGCSDGGTPLGLDGGSP